MERKHIWKVRDGDEKDLPGILSLRKIVFGEEEADKLEPRYWRWEFMDAPDGKGFIYLVQEGDKIIAHFADIPRRFLVQGKTILGTLSLDLMVHPNYRRRGLFTAMGRYSAQRVKQENRHFMTAFPIRPQTIQGLKKIGWHEIMKLPVLVYPIRFTGIVKRYIHFSSLSYLVGGIARGIYTPLLLMKKGKENRGIEIENVEKMDNQFEKFLERGSSIHSIMGLRDSNYMNWRYFNHPTRVYRIYRAIKDGEMKGYLILRKVTLLGFNSVVIADLLSSDLDIFEFLLKGGIEFSKKESVDLLGFMVPKSHPYYQFLRKYGFLRSPKTFRFMIYSHKKDEFLLDPKNWYVTWGDTDVI